MRVDEFDNTLVSEDEDIRIFYDIFKEFREAPDYIEAEILNIILESLNLSVNDFDSIEDKLSKLPKSFIKSVIEKLNSKYRTTTNVEYSDFYIPYLMYYLPCNIYKVWKPLLDLNIKSLLKPSINLLDIGTGPGSIPIGIIEFYKEMALRYSSINYSLTFTLIEKEIDFMNIAITIINSIKKYLPSNLNVYINATYNEIVTAKYKNDLLNKYDIISLSNFLSINELDNNEKGEAIVQNLKEHLKDDGSIIIIEHGKEVNCHSLKRIRNNLVNKGIYNLFSPCNRVWEENNNYSCNCFNMTRSFWKAPLIFEELNLNGLDYKALREDVPFNYIILRIDGVRKYNVGNNPQHYTKIEDLKDKVGQTINIMAMIRSVVDNNKQKIIALCDGTTSFYSSYDEYALIVSNNEVIKYFGNIPIVASERITIKKVKVVLFRDKIQLYLTDQSKVKIEY